MMSTRKVTPIQFNLRPQPWRWKLRHYINQHRQACLWSVRKLTRMPLASLVALLAIGIALTLPVGLNSLLHYAQTMTKRGYDQERITLYLYKRVDAQGTQRLLHQLRHDSHVVSVTYVSPKQGLKEFKRLSGLAGSLRSLPQNPLPAVIIIQPKPSLSLHALKAFHQRLSHLSEVEVSQFDGRWAEQLHALINFGMRALYMQQPAYPAPQ